MSTSICKTIRYIALLTVFMHCSFSYSRNADDSTQVNKGLVIGLNLSTIGIGAGVTKNINKRLDVRINGSYFGYTYDIHKLNKSLKGDARLKAGVFGFNADYYVLHPLYITGGLYYNFTSVEVVAQDAEVLNVGDVVLQPKDVGIVEVKITPGSKIEPYLGMGMTFRRAKKISFGFELGLFLQGAPKVKLLASGLLKPTASPEQAKIIEKNISPLIYYPNVSFRISYRIK